MTQQNELTIRRPDDWHLHLRDGDLLTAVLPFTANVFRRAIIMPNLKPPVVKVADAVAYRTRILKALAGDTGFEPLMTAYLTDATDADELSRGHAEGAFTAAKLYPAGATTNSDNGVTDIGKIYGVLERMEEIGMPLLVHGEVTDPDVDIFDREQVFIDNVLIPTLQRFDRLKVVFEHITTAEGVAFVEGSGANIGATITPHHLVINRNALFVGGMRPHMFCLPVAKRERHRLALRAAATSDDTSFFLGTDSAPHLVSEKESDCGCAGIFNAPSALEVYAQVFDEEGALDRLEAFASLNGPAFYGMPPNEGKVTLKRGERPADDRLTVGSEEILPFDTGKSVLWRVVS
ncbi:MAG TPA: dihydroorotase [Rhodospirillaceae bacterium]|nr:dihydroorotase [Rhodospirillaceae bacterium]